MIQCQICQVTNDDTAQFCRECGGRLQAPPAPPVPSQAIIEPDAPMSEPPKRPKLHSPILGGGSDIDDDDDQPSPSFKRVKSGQTGPNPSASMSGTGNQRRGGLRSPLLGGDDAMDEEDVVPAKGKAGFGAFSGRQKKTEFPHRHHDDGDGHEPAQSGGSANMGVTGNQKGTGGRGGLRSPLLGGGGAGDDDYDDEPVGRGKRPQGKSGKLRSPILGGGGGGGGDFYDDENFDDEVEEINDPTVLRSPLLAVRTPKAHSAPAPATPKQAAQSVSQVQSPAPAAMQTADPRQTPFVQGPYGQGAPNDAANVALTAAPALNAVQAQDLQADMNFHSGPNYQPFPPNQGGQSAQATIVAPQAPSQQPAYSPPPAPPAPANFNQNLGPNATNQNMSPAPSSAPAGGQESYNFGLPNAAPVAPQPSPGYQAPLPPAPSAPVTRPNQQALPPNPSASAQAMPSIPAPAPSAAQPPKPSAKSTGTKFDAAEDERETIKPRGMRGSKLLGDAPDEDAIGPLDRRSRFADRRGTSRGDRRSNAGSDTGDQEPVLPPRGSSFADHSGSGAPAAPNPMAPILMITALVALIGKLYYLSSFISKPNIFVNNLPATADQITSLIVLVGIILFALKAAQKR